jgi:excisionase family DNA binding protein
VRPYGDFVSTIAEKDRALARAALHALSDGPRLVADDGTVLDLPVSALKALADILEATAEGERALVLRSSEGVTTEGAAAILGVSRAAVIRLVEAGELPARLVGAHRRLSLGDVLAHRERSVTSRRTALDEMARDAEELGLYD